MNPIRLLFSAETADDSNIVRWWEVRRIPYNLIVGGFGIGSLAVMFWIGGTLVEPGEDFIEPLGVLAGVFFAAFGLNLYYTQAWVAERHGAAGADHRTYRERLFRKRLVRSCQIHVAPFGLHCSLGSCTR